MANENNIQRSDEQLNSRYDPEKEIPDPEQVERDRKEAEKNYGSDQSKDRRIA